MSTDTTQADWDAEVATGFRQRLLRLVQAVREARERQARLRDRKRSAARDRHRADGELDLAIVSLADAPVYMGRLQEATRRAEQAAEAEREARQAWGLQVTTRRRLQDELRAAVRAQFQSLPLFDSLPAPAPAAPESEATCHQCGRSGEVVDNPALVDDPSDLIPADLIDCDLLPAAGITEDQSGHVHVCAACRDKLAKFVRPAKGKRKAAKPC